MEIRVKKMCLQNGVTKGLLKQWGVKIKKDYEYKNRQVKILTLPNNMRLVESSMGVVYFIYTADTYRCLGYIYDPFEFDGGVLVFAP